jgi:hypothetical protein
MKQLRYSTLFLFTVCLINLIACSLEEVSPQAKQWLKGTNGESLTFADSLGNKTILIITLKRKKEPNTLGKLEIITIYYEGVDALAKLKIEGEKDWVTFYQYEGLSLNDPYYSSLGMINEKSAVPLSATVTGAALLKNVAFHGKTYAALLIFPVSVPGSGFFEKIYYSKEDGLVAYQAVDHTRWYRIF